MYKLEQDKELAKTLAGLTHTSEKHKCINASELQIILKLKFSEYIEILCS